MSKVVYVSKLPTCDLHGGHPAKYDIKIPGNGRWGNVCEDAYNSFGRPELGTGKGQELIEGEAPEETDSEIRANLMKALDEGDMDAAFGACGDRDPLDFL